MDVGMTYTNTFVQTSRTNKWLLKHRVKNIFWGEGRAGVETTGDKELDLEAKKCIFTSYTKFRSTVYFS
jgi:hypothetical protein